MYRRQLYIDTTVEEKINSPPQLQRKHHNKLFTKSLPIDISANKNEYYRKNNYFCETMYDINEGGGFYNKINKKNKRNKRTQLNKTGIKCDSLPKIN